MRFIGIATLVAASWIMLSLSAAAQDSNSPDNFEQRFAAANVTRDGCLTRQQAVDGGLNGILRDFAAIDTARRGCVTLDQIRQFRLSSKFVKANTTHDGCLTRQQAIDGQMKQIVRYFDLIDTLHRGCLTLEQVKKFVRPERGMKIRQKGGKAR